MSIVKVILFYSKHSSTSLEMKNMVDKFTIDIVNVCVDSKRVKEKLLNDEKYNIVQIPSILAFYIPPQEKNRKKHLSKLPFKVFSGKELVTWFNQLLNNIVNINNQASGPPPRNTESLEMTPIEVHEGEDYTDIVPSSGAERRTSLSGGLPIQGGEAAMINNRVISRVSGPRGSSQGPEIDYAEPGKKEIKKNGLSAKEIAEQIAGQREEYDENIDNNKPFI